MSVALRSHLSRWLSRPRDPEGGPITLSQRRVYILPTGAGLLFAGTVLVMLLGCINYNLGLGYVLMFLMSGIGIVSILHTFRNLAQLQLKGGRPEPVFTGDDAVFPVLLVNSGDLHRSSIGLVAQQLAPRYVDAGANQTTVALVRIPAQHRGRLPLGRLRVFTTFPLGLFVAWSNVELNLQCLVYPRPEAGHVPLPAPRARRFRGTADRAGPGRLRRPAQVSARRLVAPRGVESRGTGPAAYDKTILRPGRR